eukprot:TRINITY_DN10409_c0_g1_i1.p1 TRINITY_DN10409_c0_g1~~TRINITY_DN10409_c0_g1_i1.p1  ORF type:complete len:236 (-),score=37.27 TRINITY_DN10409_c0_g1_i1:154-861(-)
MGAVHQDSTYWNRILFFCIPFLLNVPIYSLMEAEKITAQALSVFQLFYPLLEDGKIPFEPIYAGGELIRIKPWLYQAHAWFSAITLFIWFFQVNALSRKKYMTLHYNLGYASLGTFLVAQFYAFSITSHTYTFTGAGGFMLMAIITGLNLLMGIIAVRKGDIENHRKWMTRTLSAYAFSFLFGRLAILAIGPVMHQWPDKNFAQQLYDTGNFFWAPLGVFVAEVYLSNDKKVKTN